MAETFTIKVEGLQLLGERMKNLSEDMKNKIARAATAAGAAVIKKGAQARVPVKTGTLKKGIVIKRLPAGEAAPLTSQHIVTVSTREMKKYAVKSRASIVELQGPIAPDASGRRKTKLLGRKDSYESYGDLFYGPFVEYGTVKMAARPFLRPAFDNGKGEAIQAMKSRIEARLKKAGV